MTFKSKPRITAEEWAANAPIKDAKPSRDPNDPYGPIARGFNLRLNNYTLSLLQRAAEIERRKAASLVRAILIPALEAIVAKDAERYRIGTESVPDRLRKGTGGGG